MLTVTYSNSGIIKAMLELDHSAAFAFAVRMLKHIQPGDRLDILMDGEEVASYDYLKLKELKNNAISFNPQKHG